MAQTCSKCSRANPVEAVYCFFDGFVLGGHDRRGGPVAVGSQLFNSPFVFPTGRTCRSFDELSLACQEEWPTACTLLRDGYLESFLGGLGRVDLALAAKEAARFPDAERGLDQLLAKFPSNVLAEPRLRVDPVEINLGQIGDQERVLQLELENQGMRLLYGTVSSSDASWLSPGDVAGSGEKHFQLTHEMQIPIHIRPDRIRSSNKPIVGKLVVESNGGTQTVAFRAEKPIVPFPEGVLAGVKTPRQVAEKAQASPKEVAPLFESGAVERWYASNHWVYPVQVPAASGIAAIQQFFEALGVARPPQVSISLQELRFEGDPGQALSTTLEVSTQEKKPVWAHVTSNVPWLEVSKPRLNKQIATITMRIAAVPDRPGTTQTGELEVIANGNRRFRVPVLLTVTGTLASDANTPFNFDGLELDATPVRSAPPPPPLPVAALALANSVETATQQVELSIEDEPALPAKTSPASGRSQARREGNVPLWMHATPAVLLGVAVLCVVLFDMLGPRLPVGAETLALIPGPRYDPRQLADPSPRVGFQLNPSNDRFGVVMREGGGDWKRLTYDAANNNTVVKIGSREYTFGTLPRGATWIYRGKALGKPYLGYSSSIDFSHEQVRVTQYVQVVPGVSNLLDTVLIWYRAENRGTLPQKIGFRVLLDTYITSNDGAPFTVPGQSGFVADKADLLGDRVPDYLEVVEKPDDSDNPGTIARVGLRGLRWGDIDLIEPDRVLICRFPGKDIKWDWEPEPIGKGKDADSAIAVYWPEKEVNPKESVNVAMTYGLGKLDISEQLALSVPRSARPGREFVVTAYVYGATRGQTVKLDLPDGLELVSGNLEQTIDQDAKRTQVFWKVRGKVEGNFPISATSGRGGTRPVLISVQNRSIFG